MLQLLKGHENVVKDLHFSEDGQWLASASGDSTVRLWRKKGDRFAAHGVLSGHENGVTAVRLFRASGKLRVLSAGKDQSVRLWDAQSLRELDRGHHQRQINSLAVGPDWLASAGDDREIHIWSYSLQLLRTLHSETIPVGLSPHPDGERLLAGTGSLPLQVNIWDIEDGTLLNSFTGHRNLTMAVGWLGEKTAVSAGGNNFEIRLWDPESAEELGRITGGGKRVWAVGLNGSRIALGTTFDFVSKQEMGPLEHVFDFSTLNISEEGSSDTIDRARFPLLPKHHGTYALEHQPDEDGGYEDAVLVIRKNDCEPVRIQRGNMGGYRHRVYGFTPKGRIVSGGSNGRLHIYDHDGKILAYLYGHEGEILSLAVGGQRMLSGSGDQTVKVWDLSELDRFQPEVDWEWLKHQSKFASAKMGQQWNAQDLKLYLDMLGMSHLYKTRLFIQPLVTLYFSFEKTHAAALPLDWVAWTKSGYYASSVRGGSLIGFHVNHGQGRKADFLEISHFQDQLLRPDIVRLTFRHGSEEAALTIASGVVVSSSALFTECVRSFRESPASGKVAGSMSGLDA